ncbi:MAG TPA: hypothetical protein VG621_02285 [Candidatus Paceibacterota bacterium]|nr:hypothetical protein [Candidatus Paceibacterota bacterium]
MKERVVQNFDYVNIKNAEKQQVDKALLFLYPKKRNNPDPNQAEKHYANQMKMSYEFHLVLILVIGLVCI